MRSTNTVLVIRGVMAALFVALAIVSFAEGADVRGVLLLALGGCSVAMLVAIQRRRRHLRDRFPGPRTQRLVAFSGSSGTRGRGGPPQDPSSGR
ncbi:MAG TPA: hypothetical protein VIC35_02480 [Acidimicrobiia bacterium]|jgi:hypothetical protein